MPAVKATRPALVWGDLAQAALLRDIAAAAGLLFAGAGSPERGQGNELAGVLAAEPITDLRAALAGSRGQVILLASPGDFGSAQDDAQTIRAARENGSIVFTLEPVPAASAKLAAGGWTGESEPLANLVRFVPTLRATRPLREAAEPLRAFSPPTTIIVESYGRPEQGTLGARAFACLELVHALLGEPESLDAVYSTSTIGRGVHPSPGETLRGLHGTLTANLRYSGGRAATIVASSQGARWTTVTTLLSPAGRLRLFDDGFEWLDASGAKLDELRLRPRGKTTAPTEHAAAAIASAVVDALNTPRDATSTDHAAVLLLAETALLSARTGQSESPATIRRMAGM